MVRPQIARRIPKDLQGLVLKPQGIPRRELETNVLTLDGLEALRLADLEGLYQEAAAERMDISRPTFARILARARLAVARALIEERVLVVGEGPVVEASDEPFPCAVHDGGRRRGQGCRCRHQQGGSRRGRGPR